MVADVLEDTALVEILKVCVVLPTGIATSAGTETSEELDDNFTMTDLLVEEGAALI
jgi:hypothetical protein